MVMKEIRKTDVFAKWIDNLKDIRAKAKVLVRIERLTMGNLGDVKAVGKNISELKISYGPGYRIYFKQHGNKLIILLAGGDKKSQQKDIKTAQELADNL